MDRRSERETERHGRKKIGEKKKERDEELKGGREKGLSFKEPTFWEACRRR